MVKLVVVGIFIQIQFNPTLFYTLFIYRRVTKTQRLTPERATLAGKP